MEYSVQRQSNSKIEFCFDVNKEEWLACINEAYAKNKNKYQIEGFRRGKVPFNVLVKRYGIEIFYEDAIDVAIQKYWSEAIEKENFELVDNPALDIKEVSEDGLKFVVEITVTPEFTLGAYTGFSVEKEEINVTDEQVEMAINSELNKHTRYIDVDDRNAELGDVVTIDYSGSVNGVKFDGGTAEKQPLELGSGQFIPGFEEQVVGMAIGEEKDINVTFPQEYHAELAGKDAVFAIKLHEIKKKEVPALDDEFVKDISDKDTVEEYKQDVKEKLTKNATQRALNVENDRLIRAIVEKTEIDIPEVMIENELDKIVEEEAFQMQQRGYELKTLLENAGMKMEDYRARFKEEAQNSVKTRLVVNAIVKKEDITATDADIDAEYQELADAYGMTVDKLKEMYGKAAEGFIKSDAINKKLFAFLRDNNKFEAKKAEKKPATKKAPAKKAEDGEEKQAPAKKAPAKKPAAKKTTTKKED